MDYTDDLYFIEENLILLTGIGKCQGNSGHQEWRIKETQEGVRVDEKREEWAETGR